ncbi:MAG: TMEM175 family protein [Acidimicrobiales bacterium]
MTTLRIQAFSDGVFAILITIMVLYLRQPHGATFHDLRSSLPSFFAYALSFVLLATYWNNHHHLLNVVKCISPGLMWANNNLLFWLSLVPFVTAWMAENGFARDTVIVYGAACVMGAVAYTVLQTLIVAAHGPNSALRRALGSDLKPKLSASGYVVAIPLAFVSRAAAVAVFVVVALSWLIPDRRLQTFIDSRGGPELAVAD